MVFFQNCGQFEPISSLPSSSSSQCLARLQAKAQDSTVTSVADCRFKDSYVCERRSFGPEVRTQQYREKVCVTEPKLGEACLEVLVFEYSTALQMTLEDLPDEAFLPGGEFNRDEFRCWQKDYFVRGAPVFSADGSTLLEALKNVHSACQKGGEQ